MVFLKVVVFDFGARLSSTHYLHWSWIYSTHSGSLCKLKEDIWFSDGGGWRFFDPGILQGSKHFLLSPAPIHTYTKGGYQNMQGIECKNAIGKIQHF